MKQNTGDGNGIEEILSHVKCCYRCIVANQNKGGHSYADYDDEQSHVCSLHLINFLSWSYFRAAKISFLCVVKTHVINSKVCFSTMK